MAVEHTPAARGLLAAFGVSLAFACAGPAQAASTHVAPPVKGCDRPDRDAAVKAASMDARPAEWPEGGVPAGVADVVPLAVDVDPTGAVTNIALEASSGSRAVDRAAMAAARDWTYAPAESGCRPVAGRVRVQVRLGPAG